jgi:hypothetical protein
MPGGWSRIDHLNRTGHHDDLANVVAGVLWRVMSGSSSEWMLHGNLRPVIAQLQMMGPYRRKLNTGELSFVPGSHGERAYWQMQRRCGR